MAEKSKDRSKTILLYCLAFMIPFLVITLAYVGLHITPFGDKTLIISDAKALYMSDLSFIKRALAGQENLLYSFEQGIGLNLMSGHGGLLNPANAIVSFFDITSFPAMFSWLMAIDMAVCGLTMFIFLSSVYGRKRINLIFSTVYALIGFNVAYCFQIYFLLSVELLPLIALGIKRIIDGKAPWLYLITLAYTIFSGFYYGYIVCIASIVLFLMWYAEKRHDLITSEKKRIWITYIGTSVTAGLLSAFVWIPAYLSLKGGRADQSSILDFSMTENMSLGDAFAKFFIGTNDFEELVNGKPNIFCGLLIVFLVITFFLDSRKSTKTKLIRGLPLTFYFVTFYVKAFSMMMQGFTVTNWFNFRYSFVFSFLLIITAFEEFLDIRHVSSKDFKRSCIVFIVFVVFVFTQSYSFASGGWMIIDVLILAFCLGAIWWNRVDGKRAPKGTVAIFLILMISIEGYANYIICTKQILEYGFKEKEYQEELLYGSVLADSITNSDKSFYRMVNEHSADERCNNDPRLFGYNGVNYFGSCEKKSVFQGMSKLGLPWWSNRMWYEKGLPEIFDSLFGIKYVISQRDLSKDKQYNLLVKVGKHTIYKNINALPIGMTADDKVIKAALGRDPFRNHNELWKAITSDNENVFTEEKNLKFTYHAYNDGENIDYKEAQQYSALLSKQAEEQKKAGNDASESDQDSLNNVSGSYEQSEELASDSGRYIECTFKAQKDGSIYSYAGAGVQDKSGSTTEPMRYLGKYKKGDIVTDHIAVNTKQTTKNILKGICAEYYVAYVNDSVLDNYCKKIKDSSGSIEKETDSHLIGKVDAGNNDRLFFTIPYEKGWKLKIDGSEVKLEKTADLFMSARVPKGSHSYELTFFPEGMKTGIAVSCGAVLMLLVLIAYTIALKRKRNGSVAIEKEQFDDII